MTAQACPKCGGPTWDNRNGKRNPKAPDYRCKDKQNCDGAVWEKKQGGGGNGSGGAAVSSTSTKRPLGPLYNECLEFAKKACAYHFVGSESVENVLNMTTTLFIAAQQTGAPLIATKAVAAPAPKPAPPPPKPQPVPEPEYQDDSALETLPF